MLTSRFSTVVWCLLFGSGPLAAQTGQFFVATATKRILSVTTTCNTTAGSQGQKVNPDLTLPLTGAIPDQSYACGFGSLKTTGFSVNTPLTIQGTESTPAGFPVTFNSTGNNVSVSASVGGTVSGMTDKNTPTGSIQLAGGFNNVSCEAATHNVSKDFPNGSSVTLPAQTSNCLVHNIELTGRNSVLGPNAFEIEFIATVSFDADFFNTLGNHVSMVVTVKTQYQLAPAGPPAQISVTPASLSFSAVTGGKADPQTFSLSNPGGSTLNWTGKATTGDGAAWLTFAPAGGTLAPAASVPVTVTVDPSKLGKGAYSGSIAISSSDDPTIASQTLAVNLSVGGPATLTMSNGFPDNGSVFEEETVQRFGAHVVFGAGDTAATVDLELTDQDGHVVAHTDPLDVAPGGTFESDFIIGSIIIPKGTKQLSMQAVLRRGSTVVQATPATDYRYTVVGPPFVSIARLGALNQSGSRVLEGPISLEPATVGYYRGAHVQAAVLIRCTGGDGSQLGQSNSLAAAPPGATNLNSAELTMPDFTIPAGAQQLICFAVLQDKVTGDEIKGPAWTMAVDSGGSVKLLLGTTTEMPVSSPFLNGGAGYPVYLETGIGSRQPMLGRLHYTAPSTRYARILYSSRKADGTVVSQGELTNVELQAGAEADSDITLANFNVDNLVDYWDFWATLRSPDSSQESVMSPRVIVPVHRVRILPSPVPFPKDPLVIGTTPTFSFTAEFNQARPQLCDLIAEVLYSYANGDSYSRKVVEAPTLSQGAGQMPITITPQKPITADVYSVSLRLYLSRVDTETITAIASATYANIATPFQIPKGQSSVSGPLDFKTFVNNFGRDFVIATATQADIQAVGSQVAGKFLDKIFGKARVAPDGVAAAPQAILATAQTWQISQPIPDDGSFLADVTFHYDPQFFPDDPNFRESAMQVVSFDPATGLYITYPTTIDAKARTATARLSSLAPYYGLAVLAPFSQYSAEQPVAAGSFSVVNTGKAAANLTAVPYDAGGNPSDPVAAAIAPAQQFSLGSATARFELRADQNSLTGVDIYTGLQSFDTLPLAAPAALAVLPGIEASAGTNAWIDLANPRNIGATVTLGLFDNSGNLVDTATVALAAKGFASTGVGQLFPKMTPPFQGYAIVTSTLPVTAAKRTEPAIGGSALGALPVAAVQGPSGVQRSAHLIFNGARDTSLRLVNLSGDARITISAFAEDGTPVGTPLTTTVASGAQFWQDVGAALQLAPVQSWTGTIQIQGAPPGMLGAVSFGDPMLPGLAELPLRPAGDNSVIMPYLANDGVTGTTSVYVANAGSAAANVQLKSYNPDGSLAGAANLKISTNGRASGTLSTLIAGAAGQAGGYLTVDSDQPVVAFAVVGSAKDFATVIGQAAPGNAAATVPAPAIGVSPSGGLAFNNAPAGPDNTQTLTISNAGTLPLTVSKLTVTGPQFSITGPALPFTVAAGAQQAVTVHFRSAAAGQFSDTLLIVSNDPAQGVLPMALAATAVSAAATDRLAVSPTTLDFGSVTAGSARDMTVVATNQGTAPFTLSAAVVGSTAFSVTAPVLPATLAANQTVQINIHFAPGSAGTAAGTVSLTTNGGARVDIAVQGVGAAVATSPVLLSDDFKRANVSDPCALGPADLALGGSGTHYYLPLFPAAQTIAVKPQGAILVSNALQNSGADFGGVMFTATATPCDPTARGETIGQDLNLRASLFVPGDAAGHTTAAGPFFRTRAAAAGDGIYGGTSAGYWIQLYSTGEVRVKQLNPIGQVASTGLPASFDNTALHTLEAAAQGASLQVSLDGKLLTFLQGSTSTTTVAIPATPGSNDGAAGIGFAAEDNRGALGGQRATNAVVSRFTSLAGLPVQPLGSTGGPQTVLKVDGGTFNNAIGFTFGAGVALFVNRLTPAKYPATITGIQVYFGNRAADGLPLNAPFNTFVGVNPAGTADLSFVSINQIVRGSGTVGALASFNTYPVQPVTIQSGDFVVGFSVNDPAGIRPADLDQASPSQGRSYVSNDGIKFSLIDLGGPAVTGNFGIRALVQ